MSVYEAAYSRVDISEAFKIVLNCDVEKFDVMLRQNEDLIYSRSDDGTTLLIAAAYTGCERIVDIILRICDGEMIEESAANGMTALMTAASRGFHRIVQMLLSNGHADVNSIHKFAGTTALHMAAQLGFPVTISVLCEYGANPMLRTSVGSTPLHVHASIGGNETAEVIDALTRCGADIMALMNEDTTPLYLAAQNGHHGTVEALIQRGADANFAMPVTTYRGQQHLISYGSPLDEMFDSGINSEAGNGATAMHAAAEEGRVDVMKVFIKYSKRENCDGGRIKRVDLNTQSMGISPLHSAAQYNHPEIVAMLIEAGADVNIMSKIDGATPLYFAIGRGYSEVISALIKGNASLTIGHRSDTFPLLYAVIRRQYEVVRQLVEAGVPINISTPTGLTAIHAAANSGQSSILKYLLKEVRRSRYETCSPCKLNADGDSILHSSIRGTADENIVTLLLQHVRLISLPDCDAKTFVNLRSNNDSSTALHLASLYGTSSTVKALILESGNCNTFWRTSNMELVTPLLLSVRRGNVDVAKVLLAHGCDIEAENTIFISRNDRLHETRVTALLVAVDRKDLASVKLLLQHGANINHGISGGGILESPLLLAVAREAADVAIELLQNGASCNIVVASSANRSKQESLLDIARRKRDYDMIKALSSHERCKNVLGTVSLRKQ